MRGILLVRHGNTTWDDRVDAILNPPLDIDGVKKVERTAQFIKDNGLSPTRVIVSPLQRTMRTAQIIAGQNFRVLADNKVLPWNLGDLMGKKTSTVEADIDQLLANPNRRAPHGESYMAFYDRWTKRLAEIQEFALAHPEEQVMIVTHSRNINSLQEYIDGNPIGDVIEVTPEASVTFLAKTGSGAWDYYRIWDGK